MREAAVYVIVLMLPLAFAALVWPARRVWAVRAVELLVALILSKFAIVAVLALGGAALGQQRPAGVDGDARRASCSDARGVRAVGAAAAAAAGRARERRRGLAASGELRDRRERRSRRTRRSTRGVDRTLGRRAPTADMRAGTTGRPGAGPGAGPTRRRVRDAARRPPKPAATAAPPTHRRRAGQRRDAGAADERPHLTRPTRRRGTRHAPTSATDRQAVSNWAARADLLATPVHAARGRGRDRPTAAHATGSARSSGAGSSGPSAPARPRSLAAGALLAIVALDQRADARPARSLATLAVRRLACAVAVAPLGSRTAEEWAPIALRVRAAAARSAGTRFRSPAPDRGMPRPSAPAPSGAGSTIRVPTRPRALRGVADRRGRAYRDRADRRAVRARRAPADRGARVPGGRVLAARPRGAGAPARALGPGPLGRGRHADPADPVDRADRARRRATSSRAGCTPSAIRRSRCAARR